MSETDKALLCAQRNSRSTIVFWRSRNEYITLLNSIVEVVIIWFMRFAIKNVPQIASTWINKYVYSYLQWQRKTQEKVQYCCHPNLIVVTVLLLYIFQGKRCVCIFIASWHCGITESLKNLNTRFAIFQTNV